jgi:hypothetical protein
MCLGDISQKKICERFFQTRWCVTKIVPWRHWYFNCENNLLIQFNYLALHLCARIKFPFWKAILCFSSIGIMSSCDQQLWYLDVWRGIWCVCFNH